MSRGRSRAVTAALVAATIAWLTAGAIYLVVLIGHQIEGDVFHCGDRPVGSSNYGQATWQWWYPGTSCRYPAVDATPATIDEPSARSGIAAIGLVVWPAALVLAARRHARRNAQHRADSPRDLAESV